MNSSKKTTKQELGPVDKILYELCLVALGIMIAAVLLYICTGFSILSLKYPCLFNKLTDLPCPGCGGTRSFRALVHGDVLLCLYYYFPLLPAIIVAAVFMIRCFLYRHLGVRKSPDGTVVKYIYIFIGLLFVQWILKLVSQIGFGYYWLLNNPFK